MTTVTIRDITDLIKNSREARNTILEVFKDEIRKLTEKIVNHLVRHHQRASALLK